MRSQSEYHLTCLCGAEVVSATKSTKCGECGRRMEIVWPAEDGQGAGGVGGVGGVQGKPERQKTISEKYDNGGGQ